MNKQSMKMNLRNKGFTLIEALIGMVMVTAGMVAMVTVSDIQSASNRRVKFNTETSRFVNDIQLLLENDDACRNTITAAGPVTDVASLNNAVNTLRNSDAGASVYFTEEDIYDVAGAGIVRVDDIRTAVLNGYGGPMPANGEYGFRLQFVMSPVVDSGKTVSQVVKELPEPIYLTLEGGVVVDCLTNFGRMLEEIRRESCESVGGVFGRVPSDRDIWCTFPGVVVGADRESGDAPFDSDTRVVARDYMQATAAANNPLVIGEGVYTTPYGDYLRRTGLIGVQTISGPLVFTGLNGANASGVRITGLGAYPGPASSVFVVDEFERNVPNYNWMNSSMSEMLRYKADAGAYCDESVDQMVVLTSTGPRCVNMSTMSCLPVGGVPRYLQGFNADGSAICTALIGGNTSCAEGEEFVLTMSGGSLSFQCNACSAPSSWQPVGPAACSCSGQRLEICQTPCGGTCLGGAVNGDTRTVSCTAPAGCSPGGPGGSCIAYPDFDMCGSICLGKPQLTPVATACCSGEPDYPGPNAPCE